MINLIGIMNNEEFNLTLNDGEHLKISGGRNTGKTILLKSLYQDCVFQNIRCSYHVGTISNSHFERMLKEEVKVLFWDETEIPYITSRMLEMATKNNLKIIYVEDGNEDLKITVI